MIDLSMTSGYHFEGYQITEYLGFYSGECVLGTGYFSTRNINAADTFGIRSTKFEEKLAYAKSLALNDLAERAMSQHANAIIGLSVNFITFSSDIIGVIANGTAVYMEPEETQSEIEKPYKLLHFMLEEYNPDCSLRPTSIELDLLKNRQLLSLNIVSYSGTAPEAIDADLTIHTVFHDTINISNVYFLDFREQSKVYVSTKTLIELPEKILPIIKSIQLKINKYVENGSVCSVTSNNVPIVNPEKIKKLRPLLGADVFCEYLETSELWTCICGKANDLSAEQCSLCERSRSMFTASASPDFLSDFLETIESLPSVRQILTYSETFNAGNNNILTEEIMNIIKKYSSYERIYGNGKEECIRMLKEKIY